MKKAIFLIFSIIVLNAKSSSALNVTIIESQSANVGHVMDTVWQSFLTTLGHTATIVSQTTLDNTSFFSTTDILIVSSGVIAIPANRQATLLSYLMQGGKLFLQTEYDATLFTSNQTFAWLVNSLGGTFNWIGTVSGTLAPMNISGSLATFPNCVAPLSYFWYGANGNAGVNVESFLHYQGNDFGFIFCGTGGVGRMITTSDQDWIRTPTSNDYLLMENIFDNLIAPSYNCNAVPLLLGSDTTICPGDSLNLNTFYNNLSYLWQDGSTNSSFVVTTPGTFWVTATSPCAIYIDSIIITQGVCNFQPIVALSSSDTSFCEKQCIDFFDLSTNLPTSWQWTFNGATPDTATQQNPSGICYNGYGSFDVTLIACNNFGCDTLTITNFINEFQNPIDSIYNSNDTLWSLPFPSYQWYEISAGLIAGATNQYFIASNPGSYYCVANDSIGCIATSNTIAATGFTPNPSLNGEGSIVIAPNPNDGNFLIVFNQNYLATFNGRVVRLRISDTLGKEVFQSEILNSKSSISTTLTSGIYFVRIASEDGNLNYITKLIVQ